MKPEELVLAFYPPRPATMEDFYPGVYVAPVVVHDALFIATNGVSKTVMPWVLSVLQRTQAGCEARKEVLELVRFADAYLRFTDEPRLRVTLHEDEAAR